MLSDQAVPDPTDWIGTPLASLSSLESALQCHVCKELFHTPMITSCSHTFCSLCIRRCLSQEGRCPACRTEDQESKLRRNWAMEECVNVYEKQRGGLLNFARKTAKDEQNRATASAPFDERPPKRRRTRQPNGASMMSQMPMRSTRSHSRSTLQANPHSRERSFVEDSEDDGSQYLEDSSSPRDKSSLEPDDGLVACPMCGNRMKEEAVFAHLDECGTGGQSLTQSNNRKSNGIPSTSVAYSVPSPTKARQRLGALNYSLLTETSLRRKLAEIGIPSYGPKPLLQRRHMEWMNLWNASCDSTYPETKRELLRELEVWERTQGRQITNTQAPSGVMAKTFDAENWTKSNKDNFTDLVRKARERAHAPISNEIKAREGGASEAAAGQPGNPETVPSRDPHSAAKGVVDLPSPAKPPPLEQHGSQGSQMNGLAA